MSTLTTYDRVMLRLGRPNVFMAVFGAYLALHFAQLLNVSGELFSSTGMLPDMSASPFFGRLPGLFFICDAPWFVQGCVAVAVLLSVTLAGGRYTRFCAATLLVILSSLYLRNPLISNPSLAYVGFALLVLAICGRPATSLGRAVDSNAVFTAVVIVLGVSYTYAGLEKLGAPSWQSGQALAEVLASPLARSGVLAEFLRTDGAAVLKWGTYASLALEIFALALLLMRKTRAPTVLALMGLHVGILLTVNFADLTLGMLAVHILFIDPSWFSRGKRPS